MRKLEHLVLVIGVVDVEDAPAALDDPEVLAIASVPGAVEVAALVGSLDDLVVVAPSTFSVFSPFGRLLASASAAEKLVPSPLVGAADVLRVAAEALRAE